jgi:hypothetical protein
LLLVLRSLFLLIPILKSSFNSETLREWLLNQTWTPESIAEWQEFYNNASRTIVFGRADNFNFDYLPKLPEYEDLKTSECKRVIINSAVGQNSFILLTFISFVITILFK